MIWCWSLKATSCAQYLFTASLGLWFMTVFIRPSMTLYKLQDVKIQKLPNPTHPSPPRHPADRQLKTANTKSTNIFQNWKIHHILQFFV